MIIEYKTKSYINAKNEGTIKTPYLRKSHIIKSTIDGRWDGISNSSLIENAMNRRIKDLNLEYIHINSIPQCVTIDKNNFLYIVRIDLGSSY